MLYRLGKTLGWTFLGVVLLPLLAAAQGPATLQTPAISDVRVSNVRDVYLVVSWITDEMASGEVHYGPTPALGQVAQDQRGAAYEGQTHYVALTSLAPSTLYYFDVVSDGAVDDRGGTHWQVTTGPTLSPPTSDAVWGGVYQNDGITAAEGAIVYIQVQDNNGTDSAGTSALMSSLVGESGFWFSNLRSARREDLSAYFIYSVSGDRVTLEAVGGDLSTASFAVDTANDSPAPPMQLSRSVLHAWLPLGLQGWRSR